MKLRSRGNSIRLRLSQSDVATLLDTGAVEERIGFPGGATLNYRLECSSAPEATAAFDGTRIIVRFPADAIRAWAAPAEVSLSAEPQLDDGERLELLIEKDFQCLRPRDDKDDGDLFPNPGA